MATVIDDRTQEQRETHRVLICGTDGFMTRWGHRCGMVGKSGRSIAAWACTPGDAATVEAWVRTRGDLKRVRRAIRVYPQKGDHIHIYVVTDAHPSIAKEVTRADG
jgi:hypothetical protein